MKITGKIRVLAASLLLLLLAASVAEAGASRPGLRDSGGLWGELVRWVREGISSVMDKTGMGMDPNGSPAPGNNTGTPQTGQNGDTGMGMDPNG